MSQPAATKTRISGTAPPSVPVGKRPKYNRRELLTAALLLLPSMAIFAVFNFYPLFQSIYLSLHANDILGLPTRFVGMDQYIEFFSNPELRRITVVTAVFVVMTALPSVVIGIFLALTLQARIRGVNVFRTLMSTPFGFSAAATAVVFAVFFNPAVGVFNGILRMMGMDSVGWLTNPTFALPSLAMVCVWGNIGYTLLVASAGLQNIPDELYEAARLDGAGRWTVIRQVVLPLLTPTIFFLIVIMTINSLQTFGEIHILTGGGPNGATTTLVYGIYQTAFAYGGSNYGLASVQAVVLLVVVTAATWLQFRVLQRKVFYG
ncbi:sugar ABC transporter permease [Phytoactinopolyspora alkaliphila]|uniref:Sugar ABC transporter permease n=1 Tax=Phytoactinopolyspora alkaliphila TaxID=1783498 RepID=A0A6N9YT50_9ACTN|nr:sugar ABC transporter permease [Phytoactinopolyspora alkaliphila]NED98008.1 sugar ABC transporter permease [Phytoactinopolyspora alkaliphila]